MWLWAPLRFAWQAQHFSFCVASTALGAPQVRFARQAQPLKHLHRGPRKSGDKWWLWASPCFAVQVQHLEHLRLVLRGWHAQPLEHLHRVRGSPATSDDFGRRQVLRGRRSTWSISSPFCVAGPALGAPQARFAWQAQHLEHLPARLRGSCSTWSTIHTTPSNYIIRHTIINTTPSPQHHQHNLINTTSSTHYHLHSIIYTMPSTQHDPHNTVYTTSSNTPASTQHHLHNIINTTSSTQPHQDITIYTTTSTRHHLHNTIHTTPSTLHHHHLYNIINTPSSTQPHPHITICTSPSAQHHLHNTICTTPSTLHYQHNTNYTTSSNTTIWTHTHTHTIYTTSSTQHHQHNLIKKKINIYKTQSTQHRLYNTIHTTPSTLHHQTLAGAHLEHCQFAPSASFLLMPLLLFFVEDCFFLFCFVDLFHTWMSEDIVNMWGYPVLHLRSQEFP